MFLSGDTRWMPDSWVMHPPIKKFENGISFKCNGQKYQGQIEIIFDNNNNQYNVCIVKENCPSERKLIEAIPFQEIIRRSLESLDESKPFPQDALDQFAEDYGLISQL